MNLPKAFAAALFLLAPAFALAQSLFDGHWMAVTADKSLDPGSLVTFKIDRETIEMSTVNGVSYKAKLNGAEAQVNGESVPTVVSVTMPRKNVLVEVSKREGKPWQSTRTEIDTGGKSAKVTWKSLQTHKGGSYELSRQ